MSEDAGFLDLSGADTTGFEPLPSRDYDATIALCEPTAASTGNQGVKVKFAITEDEFMGRVVYTNYWLQSKDDDPAKLAKLLGMFTNFVAAVTGQEVDEVKKNGFSLENLADLIGKDCVVIVGPPDKGQTWNNVKGVKPAGSKVAPNESGLI